MIPPFNTDGNLPPGIHLTKWQEFTERFGTAPYRAGLLAGLRAALDTLSVAGCKLVYIDGSFVTAKERPEDYDACWDMSGVDFTRLDPILLTFAAGRAAQKAKFLGEFFPSQMTEAGSGVSFLKFFQTDKRTLNAKGVVALDLQEVI